MTKQRTLFCMYHQAQFDAVILDLSAKRHDVIVSTVGSSLYVAPILIYWSIGWWIDALLGIWFVDEWGEIRSLMTWSCSWWRTYQTTHRRLKRTMILIRQHKIFVHFHRNPPFFKQQTYNTHISKVQRTCIVCSRHENYSPANANKWHTHETVSSSQRSKKITWRKKREQKFRLHVDFILASYIIFDEVGNDLLHCIFIVVFPDAIMETNRHIQPLQATAWQGVFET